MDATGVDGVATTELSVSVLVGRCAIAVAWSIVPATQAGSWRPHWQRLLTALHGNTGNYRVLVTADLGLYAKWLFQDIMAAGWHPLLRINATGSCLLREAGER